MNKLIIALFAGAFAVAMPALADDSDVKPLSKMQTDEAKAAREAAKAKWDKMTPQEQDAARKAARAKKLADATAIDMIANESGSMRYDPKAGAEATATSKQQPKATKEERQKALKEQEKKSSGQ
jgi:hypothetical protein